MNNIALSYKNSSTNCLQTNAKPQLNKKQLAAKNSLLQPELAFGKNTLDSYSGILSKLKKTTDPLQKPDPDLLLEQEIEDANIATDAADCDLRSTAIINGSNFDLGETVELPILHADNTPNTGGGQNHWRVTDGDIRDLDRTLNGQFETNWYVNLDDSVGSALKLTATGLDSNRIATRYFTNAENLVCAIAKLKKSMA